MRPNKSPPVTSAPATTPSPHGDQALAIALQENFSADDTIAIAVEPTPKPAAPKSTYCAAADRPA